MGESSYEGRMLQIAILFSLIFQILILYKKATLKKQKFY